MLDPGLLMAQTLATWSASAGDRRPEDWRLQAVISAPHGSCVAAAQWARRSADLSVQRSSAGSWGIINHTNYQINYYEIFSIS